MVGVSSAATAVTQGTAALPVSKYLQSILGAPLTGTLTLTTTADTSLPTDARQRTIVMAPYIKSTAGSTAGAPLAAGLSGSVQWSCMSSTTTQATARGFTTGAPAAAAALPAKYAPSECR